MYISKCKNRLRFNRENLTLKREKEDKIIYKDRFTKTKEINQSLQKNWIAWKKMTL